MPTTPDGRLVLATQDSPAATVLGTPTQTAVGTAAVVLLNPNPLRRRFIVQNTDTTILYLAFGGNVPTATAYHIALKACAVANDGSGAAWIDEMWQGKVQIIGSGSGGHCVVTEIQ